MTCTIGLIATRGRKDSSRSPGEMSGEESLQYGFRAKFENFFLDWWPGFSEGMAHDLNLGGTRLSGFLPDKELRGIF